MSETTSERIADAHRRYQSETGQECSDAYHDAAGEITDNGFALVELFAAVRSLLASPDGKGIDALREAWESFEGAK